MLSPVNDKSRPGGLLPGEIPGILNIRADREPMARCPVDFYGASLSQRQVRQSSPLRANLSVQLQTPFRVGINKRVRSAANDSGLR